MHTYHEKTQREIDEENELSLHELKADLEHYYNWVAENDGFDGELSEAEMQDLYRKQFMPESLLLQERRMCSNALSVPPAVPPANRNALALLIKHADAGDTLYEGKYTVVSGKDGSHRTIRVRRQPSFQDQKNAWIEKNPDGDVRDFRAFRPDELIVSVLIGSCNESNYLSIGWLIGGTKLSTWSTQKGTKHEVTVATFLHLMNNESHVGRQMLAKGYQVLESRHCIMCHRTLTTPESIARLIGPECIKKVGGG